MKSQNNEEELTMNSLWNRFKYSVQADLHTVFDKKGKQKPDCHVESIHPRGRKTDRFNRKIA